MKKECFEAKLLTLFIVLSMCCLFPGFVLHSETPDKTEPNNDTNPFVTSVYSSENAVGLRDEIVIVLNNLEKLQQEAREKNKKIILFIHGLPLNGIYPVIDGEKGGLRYFIDHSDNCVELWNRLTLTRESEDGFTRKVSISVGLEDNDPIPTKVDKYPLILARKKWFSICVVILIALLGLFIFLAVKTNIIRDVGPSPTDGTKKTYSLALTQMAIWFFIIMSSWLLLYVIKHSFSTITESMVILMGISAATGVGGVAIDANKDKAPKPGSTKGFLKDILSDSHGISFHRFQAFAWTIVLVLVFIRQVTAYMVMPEFNNVLLTLMGISSGTYLGFKVSEKPKPENAPAQDNNGGEQPA